MLFGGKTLKQQKLILVRTLWLAVLTVFLVGCTQGEDQTVPDLAIAYVKRPLQLETDTVTVTIAGVQTDVDIIVPVDPDVREATDFSEGADVYLRDRASTNAGERNITLCITDPDPNNGGVTDGIGSGDVRDLETNYDGTKLIFSLRLEDTTNGNNPPKWNIYEYDIEVGGCPTQVITDPLAAGKGDDVAPFYLPDGRIVFSSNAAVTTREVELNAGKSQFSPFDEDLNEAAVLLHVMNADGTNIKQISFNQSHDLDASVLSSGEIVFSRWDGAGNRSAIRLYTIHPDGTELKALYGLHNANVGTGGNPVQFMDPRELNSGRVLAMMRQFAGAVGGGVPVEINATSYTDINQPTVPNLGILAGSGQVSAINQDIRTDGSISQDGRYRSVYPLADGSDRALVSWTQCRLQPTDAQGLPDTTQLPTPCPDTILASDMEAFPMYGIYVYDFAQGTQLPVVIPQEGIVVDEPVVLAPRARPNVLIDKVVGLEFNQALAEQEFVGILHIRSVYDFDGNFNALGGAATTLAEMADPTMTTADQRPARYLRIVKGVAIPDPQDANNGFDANVAFGAGGRRGGMREIIGYAPIEPDGSVLTKVPANIPFSIQVVDSSGRRIVGAGKHLNWIQVRAGETLECGGCHTHTTVAPALPVPHGFIDAPTALNTGAQLSVPSWEFPGTTTDDPMTTMVDEAIYPQTGETMAQARIRVRCTNSSGVFLQTQTGCPQLSLNVSPVFFDQWADAAIKVADDTSMLYNQLDPSMAAAIPASSGCTTTWDFRCRTIVNYEDSIHPMWSVPRTDTATMALDYTCTVCHNNQDIASAAMVPMGQLDLSGGLRQDDPDQFKSYRELLVQDDVQWELVGGALAPVTVQVQLVVNGVPQFQMMDDGMGNQVPVLDGNGDPVPILVTQNVPPSESPTMSINGAIASPVFFDRFTTPGMGTVEHAGLLTPAELRLLYEWLDVGAQYFNNTFDPRILN